jgi:hypothetical protein
MDTAATCSSASTAVFASTSANEKGNTSAIVHTTIKPAATKITLAVTPPIKAGFGTVVTLTANVTAVTVQPHSLLDQRTFPAMSFGTLTRRFHPADYKSPGALWRAAKNKRWLKRYASSHLDYKELRVGDIAYEVPIFSYGAKE